MAKRARGKKPRRMFNRAPKPLEVRCKKLKDQLGWLKAEVTVVREANDAAVHSEHQKSSYHDEVEHFLETIGTLEEDLVMIGIGQKSKEDLKEYADHLETFNNASSALPSSISQIHEVMYKHPFVTLSSAITTIVERFEDLCRYVSGVRRKNIKRS